MSPQVGSNNRFEPYKKPHPYKIPKISSTTLHEQVPIYKINEIPLKSRNFKQISTKKSDKFPPEKLKEKAFAQNPAQNSSGPTKKPYLSFDNKTLKKSPTPPPNESLTNEAKLEIEQQIRAEYDKEAEDFTEKANAKVFKYKTKANNLQTENNALKQENNELREAELTAKSTFTELKNQINAISEQKIECQNAKVSIEKEVDKLREVNQNLTNNVNTLNQSNTNLKCQMDELTANDTRLTQKVERLQAQQIEDGKTKDKVAILELKIEAKESLVNELTAESNKLQQTIAEKDTQLANDKEFYAAGFQSLQSQISKISEDSNKFHLSMLQEQKKNSQLAIQVREFSAECKTLKEQRDLAEKDHAKTKEELEQTKATAKATQDSFEQLKEGFNSTLAGKDKEIAKLREMLDQLQSQNTALTHLESVITNAVKKYGQHSMPLTPPHQSTFLEYEEFPHDQPRF